MTYWFKLTPAQAIKAELKVLFPAIKFSCRYRTFSMWDAVDVEWEDWPTTMEVDAVVKKYQYWHFDGMTDYYDADNLDRSIPQAKYVQTRRNPSPETTTKLYALTEKIFTDSDKPRYYNHESMARNLFYHYSITSNNVEIVDTGATCWSGIEEKYAIVCK